MLEVTQFAERLPADLSTGTKRAVAIARALAEDPDAILYDEPTTMVDPLMAAHISDLIVKLKKTLHKTSIVVTHDTHLAKKMADRVIFLQEGRVAFFGTWAELEASPGSFPPQFSGAGRADSRAGRDRVSQAPSAASRADPKEPASARDGILGCAAFQCGVGGGAAMDCGGGAQRHFFDEPVGARGGVIFSSELLHSGGIVGAVSERGRTIRVVERGLRGISRISWPAGPTGSIRSFIFPAC